MSGCDHPPEYADRDDRYDSGWACRVCGEEIPARQMPRKQFVRVDRQAVKDRHFTITSQMEHEAICAALLSTLGELGQEEMNRAFDNLEQIDARYPIIVELWIGRVAESARNLNARKEAQDHGE